MPARPFHSANLTDPPPTSWFSLSSWPKSQEAKSRSSQRFASVVTDGRVVSPTDVDASSTAAKSSSFPAAKVWRTERARNSDVWISSGCGARSSGNARRSSTKSAALEPPSRPPLRFRDLGHFLVRRNATSTRVRSRQRAPFRPFDRSVCAILTMLTASRSLLP